MPTINESTMVFPCHNHIRTLLLTLPYSAQEAPLLGVLGAATAYVLYDASLQSAKSKLKGILKKSASAPAAADEAVGSAALVSNVVYIAAFAILATYVLPNFEALAPTMVNSKTRVAEAAVSMLLPSGLLLAHSRKLF